MNNNNVTCTIHPELEQVHVYNGDTHIGWVTKNIAGEPALTIRDQRQCMPVLSFNDLAIIEDNWFEMLNQQ